MSYLQTIQSFTRGSSTGTHIDISRIRTIDDLVNIPVTTKQDLQDFNEDFICVGRDKITDYITTSGTLGDPVTFAMTDK